VAEFNIDMGLIVDIPRNIAPEEGLTVAEWVCQDHGDLVLALGLGGPEIGHPPEKFADAFALARSAGVPCILHAGETMGPESIWSAIRVADTCRIGHGVRCVEDPTLVAYLREHQIPLEVCPTSNVCLKIYSSLAQHTLPQLLRAGLYVTINSDDPPMFNTSLTDEYIVCAREYGWDKDTIKHFVQNAARASLLNGDAKASLLQRLA
jgi:adenosine deaminase